MFKTFAPLSATKPEDISLRQKSLSGGLYTQSEFGKLGDSGVVSVIGQS